MYWAYNDGCPGQCRGVPGCTWAMCDRRESVPEIRDKGTRVSVEVYSGVLGL